MEDVLKEILYELKEIRKELNKDSPDPIKLKEIRKELNKGNDISLKVTIGDDVLVEKVIKSINDKSRMSGSTSIVI